MSELLIFSMVSHFIGATAHDRHSAHRTKIKKMRTFVNYFKKYVHSG